MDTSLLIILIINVFLIGMGVAIGARYAWAHFHPHPEEKHARDAEKAVHLSAQAREKLIQEAEARYRTVLDKTTDQLVTDLEQTASKLNKDLDSLGEKMIQNQLDRFVKATEEIHTKTTEVANQGVADITEYQTKLKETMRAEVEQEKVRLLEQIDTKLGDSVVAFLVETLQHDVDLGAQTTYLTRMLDEHKGDFTGSVKDET